MEQRSLSGTLFDNRILPLSGTLLCYSVIKYVIIKILTPLKWNTAFKILVFHLRSEDCMYNIHPLTIIITSKMKEKGVTIREIVKIRVNH